MPQTLVLLSDKTVSSIERSLNKQLQEHELSWVVQDAGFDSWLRESIDVSATLRSGAALGFLLSPRILDLPDVVAEVRRVLALLERLTPARTVLFSNVFADPTGVLPLVRHERFAMVAAEINSMLYDFSRKHTWFHVVDHAGLAIAHGVKALSDRRYEATAQMYFSPGGSQTVAKLWGRALRALERPAAKVLVVDLDNTLWRGILGENGAEGIDMSPNPGGWAFRCLQKAILELKECGILLAISSKNNAEETIKVLNEHADCLIRPKDFAAVEIGWHPKSESLRRIAEKLNLGLDAFVFLDDSAFEREEVRKALPQVRVLDFPEDPNDLVATLSETFDFDSMRITSEDRERAKAYQAESERITLRESAASPEEFYKSLELKLGLFRAQGEHADRLHQLILKTNQFNLTTERLSSDAFRSLIEREDAVVIGMRVSDKFGDSGVTGLAIVTGIGSEALVVENFLLSCRVIGRTVEHGFVHWLCERAAALGACRVMMKFVPTARNDVAKEFLERSGLQRQPDLRMWHVNVPPPDGALAKHFVSVDAGKLLEQEG